MTEWIELCSGGDCPTARRSGDRVEVRDTARPNDLVWFSPSGWALFVEAVRDGRLDHLLDETLNTPRGTPAIPTHTGHPLRPSTGHSGAVSGQEPATWSTPTRQIPPNPATSPVAPTPGAAT